MEGAGHMCYSKKGERMDVEDHPGAVFNLVACINIHSVFLLFLVDDLLICQVLFSLEFCYTLIYVFFVFSCFHYVGLIEDM